MKPSTFVCADIFDIIKAMKKFVIIGVFLFVAGSIFLSPLFVQAEGLVHCGTRGEPACQFCDIFVLFNTIVNSLLTQWMPLITVLLVAVGGFMVMTSRGVPAQLARGKEIITWALIGYGVMLASWIIVNTILSLIGIADWSGVGQWWNIGCV